MTHCMTLDVKMNESTSSEKNKTISLHNGGNISVSSCSGIRHNSALVPHSSGGQKVN